MDKKKATASGASTSGQAMNKKKATASGASTSGQAMDKKKATASGTSTSGQAMDKKKATASGASTSGQAMDKKKATASGASTSGQAMNKKKATASGASTSGQAMDKKKATASGTSTSGQAMDKKKATASGASTSGQAMHKKKATASGHSSSGQASTTSKSGTARQRDNTSRVQNVLLIWLDNSIDEKDTDCQNTLAQLRRVINAVSIFTGGDECIEFINSNQEKVCIIVSGALGQLIVPLVHHMSQVDSIFIFCGNRQHHEQWAKEWPKIKGVYTEIAPICKALKGAAQQCEHNAIGMSFMPTSGGASSTALDQLDCSFMYTQIMKEILLEIEFEEQHIQEYIDYCREAFVDNDVELENIRKLERKYREETPIWWYTFECFLYPMLNRALRTMDVNIIIMMGFFVTDLHRHIERLHIEQFGAHPQSQVLTVYRGQGLSNVDFDQLVKTKGGLMSFNSFLSTSKTRDVSLDFARKDISNPDIVGVLFVMTIDPSSSTTPFASISGISYLKAEDEILFSMHTIFRIREIKSMGENNRLWQVELTLTSDNDKDLRVLTDRIREETQPDATGWYQLGSLLLTMGQPDKAEQVYKVMLGQADDEDGKGVIYNQLGSIKVDQRQYEEAIVFYEQSLAIHQKTLPPTHSNLTNTSICIGVAYSQLGEHSKALSYYEKALEIQQKTLPPTHPDLAMSYGNIGTLYYSMGEYPKALSSHEKALEIQQKSLPPTHPDLAKSYGNIGRVYYSMVEYSKALSYYEKALEIYQKTLPPTHPDLASSYVGIGLVYYSMGEYPKALSYYEKDLEIQQKTLPPTHPSLASSYNNIGNVYDSIGEYPKALSYHEKALEIRQKTLPPTHPDLASSYEGIGCVYYSMEEYSKALSYHEKALEIRQKTLPPTHPDLAMSYYNIGAVYYSTGEYSKAVSFYQRAVDIGQQSLPKDHHDLQDYRNNLELAKEQL